MRAKSIVLLLIAGVCGLVASIGVSQVLEKRNKTKDVVLTELFVATADIDIGAKLDATNVKLDKWPKDRIPEGAITKLEDIKDKFPRMRLFKGEPVLTAKLMDSNSGTDNAATVPEGYRVVSVKVTIDEVVSGLVKPGDRVDVILYVPKSEEVKKTFVQTFLKDIRVFAIDSKTERATEKKDGDDVAAKTVSLLVKPEQVQSVMLASELGKMRLSLRRPNDSHKASDDEGTDIEQLLGDVARREEVSKAKPADPTPSFLETLTKPKHAGVGTPAPAEKAAHRMTILSPTGPQEFEWSDPTQLPTTVGAETNEPARSTTPALPLATVPTTPTAEPTPPAPTLPPDAK